MFNALYQKIIYDKRVTWMNDLSLLAIAFIIYANRECWSWYSYVLLLRKFQLWVPTYKSYSIYCRVNDWTYSKSAKIVRSAYKSTFQLLSWNRQCIMRTNKTLPGVDTSLTGDYKLRAEDGLEMFKNCTRQSWQLLTIHNGGNKTWHTIGLDIYNWNE